MSSREGLLVYNDDAMAWKIVIEPAEEGGFTAYVPALPGCVTEGETEEETLAHMREAIALYLEGLRAQGREVPNEI